MPSTSSWRPLMSNPAQGASDLDRWIVYCWLFLRQWRKSESSRRSPAIQYHRAKELSVYCAGVEQLSCGALNRDKCDSFHVLLTCIILHILHYKVLNATVSFQFLLYLVMLWFGQSPESGGSVSDSGPPWRPEVQRHQRRHLGLCDLRQERQLRVEDVLLEPHSWCSWRQRTELQVFAAWCDYFSMSSISLYPTSCLKYNNIPCTCIYFYVKCR